MPRRFPHARVRVALACALLAAASPPPAGAMAPPEVALRMGSTVGANGSPGTGGASASLALMWPFEQRFAFGGVLYADDLGTDFVELQDPNTGEPLGTVASLHRMGYGAGWRVEARVIHSEVRRWRFLWGAEFGYARQERDQRGLVDGAVSGLLASTGPTFLFRTMGGHSFGGTVAWKHAFIATEADPDRTTDWGLFAFTWRWQPAPRE